MPEVDTFYIRMIKSTKENSELRNWYTNSFRSHYSKDPQFKTKKQLDEIDTCIKSMETISNKDIKGIKKLFERLEKVNGNA